MIKIPVKNIYYMLCYAWNILEEADKVAVDLDSYDQEINLLGKLLNNGLNHQFKCGVYKDYVEASETLSLIKGKINFSDSCKKLTFQKSQAVCSFDNYSENNICNQIIKTALERVFLSEHIEKELSKEIKRSLMLFANVETVEYRPGMISNIKIPRNFPLYRFLLSVSEFILLHTSQNQRTGKYQFTDFVKDEHRMRRLYEKFVYNFYVKEMGDQYHVTNTREKYVGGDHNHRDGKYVPHLITDIELVSKINDKKIILDTKFTQQTLEKNMYGQEKIHSKYLMQLMTYLENRKRKTGEIYSGVLLYPTIDKHYEFSNRIWDYHISIFNINLNEEWESVHKNLIRLIEKSGDTYPRAIAS